MRAIALLVGLATVVSVDRAHAADRPPDWLRAAASASTASASTGAAPAAAAPEDNTPAAIASRGAVVLLDEAAVTVAPDGRLTIVRRYAARVRTADGRSAARIAEVYMTDSDRVRSIRGWLLDGDKTTELGEPEALDAAADADDVYNDVRVRVLDVSARATPGTVFGAEVITESRSSFLQFEWLLQDRWAIDIVRRTLTLPAGWTATAVTFNHEPIAPAAVGASQTWELRGLRELGDEPLSPALTDLAPRLAVTVHPAAGAGGVTFRTWNEVGAWAASLAQVTAPADAPVAAKARELTMSASTEVEKIAAIARFVQGLQYISIQTGVGRGGGYKPHAPAQVLARGYGDCKDKANLMRALLGAVGIRSHLVLIYSGDRRYVRREWPSPQQFNHCIIAITLSQPAPAWTTLDHPKAGRVLFFDPTDPYGALGDLPDHEQGSLALLALPEGDDIVSAPMSPAEQQGASHEIDATLEASGRLTARFTFRWRGQAAVDHRARMATLSATEYREAFEARVRQSLRGATISNLQTQDDRLARTFTVTLDAEAASAMQPLASLLVLTAPQAGLLPLPTLERDSRRLPIELGGYRFEERVRITLPDGVVVDELPAPVSLDRPMGRYSRRWEAEGNRLSSERTLHLVELRAPASAARDVRAFVREVRDADAQPAVLKRIARF
jgi:transglutaminase-like putative cysteine protease